MYAKDPHEATNEKVILKHLNDFKDFVEYFNDMDDIYKKYWRIQPKQEVQNINCFWWYDYWYV